MHQNSATRIQFGAASETPSAAGDVLRDADQHLPLSLVGGLIPVVKRKHNVCWECAGHGRRRADFQVNGPDAISEEEFGRIVRCTPLISIDIVIRDPERTVLLGLRNHEPAKGYYFVPGGRIRKGELIAEAFSRILAAETGYCAHFESTRFLGVYQHIYSSNRFGDPTFGTHYVVLAYELNLNVRPALTLDYQHSVFEWMTESELKSRPIVHQYTKAYFQK